MNKLVVILTVLVAASVAPNLNLKKAGLLSGASDDSTLPVNPK